MRHWAGCERQYFGYIDSTNRRARMLARDGAPHGFICVAGNQTEGRGRRGRDWVSAPGLSLLLSIILRPKVEAASRPLFSYAIALAAADACEAACRLDTWIKWPNDIIIQGKKVAGILLEGEGDAIIAGIGINVKQKEHDFPTDVRQKAASLEMVSGKRIDLDWLEAALLDSIETRMDGADCLQAYRKRCITLGAQVCVIGENTWKGTAVDIDPSGALLVRDSDGIVHTVFAGDVSIKGENGYV